MEDAVQVRDKTVSDALAALSQCFAAMQDDMARSTQRALEWTQERSELIAQKDIESARVTTLEYELSAERREVYRLREAQADLTDELAQLRKVSRIIALERENAVLRKSIQQPVQLVQPPAQVSQLPSTSNAESQTILEMTDVLEENSRMRDEIRMLTDTLMALKRRGVKKINGSSAGQ